MLGLLLCPSKATVSNLICTRGGQYADWTADYRLYSKERVDESVLFGRVRDTLIENLAPQGSVWKTLMPAGSRFPAGGPWLHAREPLGRVGRGLTG